MASTSILGPLTLAGHNTLWTIRWTSNKCLDMFHLTSSGAFLVHSSFSIDQQEYLIASRLCALWLLIALIIKGKGHHPSGLFNHHGGRGGHAHGNVMQPRATFN